MQKEKLTRELDSLGRVVKLTIIHTTDKIIATRTRRYKYSDVFEYIAVEENEEYTEKKRESS